MGRWGGGESGRTKERSPSSKNSSLYDNNTQVPAKPHSYKKSVLFFQYHIIGFLTGPLTRSLVPNPTVRYCTVQAMLTPSV